MVSDTPWKNFSRKELECKCGCGKMEMDSDFMHDIQRIRDRLGFPFVVTSAYRCEAHDRSVGGSSSPGHGPHTTGRAIDIAIRGANAWKLLQAAAGDFFRGIGVNQRGDRRFIHIDDIKDDTKRPALWSY